MTIQPEVLRALVGRYDVRVKKQERPAATDVWLAWYRELPFCLAQGPDRDGALAELDALAVPYLQRIIAAGASAPVPIAQRPVSVGTLFWRIRQLVLGDVRHILGKTTMAVGKTVPVTQSREAKRGDKLIHT